MTRVDFFVTHLAKKEKVLVPYAGAIVLPEQNSVEFSAKQKARHVLERFRK